MTRRAWGVFARLGDSWLIMNGCEKDQAGHTDCRGRQWNIDVCWKSKCRSALHRCVHLLVLIFINSFTWHASTSRVLWKLVLREWYALKKAARLDFFFIPSCMWTQCNMFFLELLPFLARHFHFRKVGRGGGHLQVLKKIYQPRVIFKVLGPPCLKSDLTGCENLKDLMSVYSSSPFTLPCRWPRCDTWFTDDHYSGLLDKDRIQTQRVYVMIVQYPCASRTLAKTLSHLFPGKSKYLQENIYTFLITLQGRTCAVARNNEPTSDCIQGIGASSEVKEVPRFGHGIRK